MKPVTAPPMEKREASSSGFSAFSNCLPSVDRWLAKRAAVKGLAAEADRLERKASEWEGRGHWQLAGRCREMAAKMAERSLDISFAGEVLRRRDALLRGAIVAYAVEIGDAGRYDPAIQFRMYMVARKLGEPAVARRNLDKAMKGFDSMFTDRNLEALVRLNRLKREFIRELWEGESSEAFRIAKEALSVAAGIRTADGTANRAIDTSGWLDAQVEARYGGQKDGD